MRNLRYLQHSDKARIEPDLTLTRIGKLSVRMIESLVRGLLVRGSGKDAVIFEGLDVSPVSGMTMAISTPAAGVQMIDGDDVKVFLDYNDGDSYEISIPVGDVDDRIDIIEARITEIDAYSDDSVYVADPVTQSVTPETRYRDKHIKLEFQSKQGTPGGSPVAPTTTAATQGKITGTVAITTIDLSTKYNLAITVGTDREWVTVDCRGATPSATTLAEIKSKINAAGFGTIATDDGSNHLVITAPGYGDNSILKIKEPLDETKDCYNLILGGTETPGYCDEFYGNNKWFKVAEIIVYAGTTTLTASHIRTLSEIDTWDAESDKVYVSKSFENHRLNSELDHPEESVFWKHFAPDAKAKSGILYPKFRGLFCGFHEIDGNIRKGQIILEPDVTVSNYFVDTIGTFLTLFQQEQKYPVSRKIPGYRLTGSDLQYLCPLTLTESALHTLTFTFPLNENSDRHRRVKFKCYAKGSGYNYLVFTLHNASHTVLDTVNVPIGDLTDGAWFWVDMDVLGLSNGVDYHYHVNVDVLWSVQPSLYTDVTGDFSDAYYVGYYKPNAGLYDSSDVIRILQNDGVVLVEERLSTDDDTPGADENILDFYPVDLSNDTVWNNWEYEKYIGIDCTLGRIKMPNGYDVKDYFVEFNFLIGISESSSKFISVYNKQGLYLDDYLKFITPKRVNFVNGISGVTYSFYPETMVEIINFLPTGKPSVEAVFTPIQSGKDLYIEIFGRMDGYEAGKVIRLNIGVYIDSVFYDSFDITFPVPDDKTVFNEKIMIVLSEDISTERNLVKCIIRRDYPLFGVHHSGNYQLIDLYYHL